MHRCAALLVVAAVAAAADPSTFLPAGPGLRLHVPDVAASQVRWAQTPYPRLLATAWGRILVGEWSGRLDAVIPGFSPMAGQLQALAVGAAWRNGRPASPVVALAAPPAVLRLLAPGEGVLHVAGGRASLHDGVLAWAHGPGGEVTPVNPPAQRTAADAVLMWTPEQGAEVRAEVRLDQQGLREDATVAATPTSRLAAMVAKRWADAEELRRLPPTTLWAATWQAEPEMLTALATGPASPAVAGIERWLAAKGLPTWRETWNACDGPGVLWLAEGVPFPGATLAVSLAREPAERWIAAAAAALNLVPAGEGVAGFAGIVPLAIGWLDGRLVITTEVAGLASWHERKPGFAAHPGVEAVLAEVPERTLVLGVGRGGASWAALAQFGVPLFAGMGAPQAVSLPGDLRPAADRGWMHLQLAADGTWQLGSGGLFGGPCTVLTALGVAVPATMWLRGEQRRALGEAEAPAAGPPVF